MTAGAGSADAVARTIETPVLIVGAGPVGLALAADLGSRGVPCVVADERECATAAPRASALDVRSMELMRRWGIAEQVRNAAAPEVFPHTHLYCTCLTGFEIARIERPYHGGQGPTALSPEKSQRCSQLWLDPILRDLAASYRDTRIHNSWRIERLDQRADCVLAEVIDTARRERRTIAAQRVVDCSGRDSRFRRALAIAMAGSGDENYHVAIQLRIPELWRHHDKGPLGLVSFVDERGVRAELELLDGQALYRLGLRGEAHWEQPAEIDVTSVLHEAVGVEVQHEVISRERWTSANGLAERYGEGRILLAGDAAHQVHPEVGLGLHLGFGDACDLGWKIEASLAGWALSGLIDSYEPERRSAAADIIAHANTCHGPDNELRSHRNIADQTSTGRASRAAMARSIMSRQDQLAANEVLTLGYAYRRSPLIVRDHTGEPSSSGMEYRPTTTPGARAPHRMLRGGMSTLDLFGRGFVLLRLGARPPEPHGFERAFSYRGVPLAIRTIEDPDIARAFERKLVLVRPDGHVAWRGDEVAVDPLAIADRVRGAG